VGASGGIFGLLMAFGILYADQEMYLFPLPFRIKAKYLVGIWVVVAIIAVFEPSQGGVAVFAHLGGLLFGYLWVKFMPSRGVSYAASERISACAILITAGSGGAQPENSKST
jgi:membrane associated rhomboid family serine protease